MSHILVNIKIERWGMGIGPSPLVYKYYINGKIIAENSFSSFPCNWDWPKTRTEKVFASVIKSIFDKRKYNRQIEIFVPERYLTFINRVIYHQDHPRRLLKKLLDSAPENRIDYSIDHPQDAPYSFSTMLRGAKKSHEKTCGYFETSHWKTIKQISKFGDIKIVRTNLTTVENDSDTWWINQFRTSKTKYMLEVRHKEVVKKFSSKYYSFGEIHDIKYYRPNNTFYIKTIRDEKEYWVPLYR